MNWIQIEKRKTPMNFIWLAAAQSNQGGFSLQMLLPIAALVVFMWFGMFRPQRKRQKEEQAMRDNLQVGDDITTIGGIMGRVVTVKEDSIIIETGADRTKLRILRSAVGINNSAQEKLEAEREAARQAQAEARSARTAAPGKERKKTKRDKDN
jgi:preprotein translocase subunit YajC